MPDKLAEAMKKAVGFEGKLTSDASESDGAHKKLKHISILGRLGSPAQTLLAQ